MQKGDYKTEHLELPWSYLKVYTEERHCTISFLQDQDVVRKISDMTRVCKWSCDSSYYKLWKIMYTKQSVLYHYAIFGCLSYFYKSSLKLDSNTLKSLKKGFTFFHTHTHLLCTSNSEWTGDTRMSKNWSCCWESHCQREETRFINRYLKQDNKAGATGRRCSSQVQKRKDFQSSSQELHHLSLR